MGRHSKLVIYDVIFPEKIAMMSLLEARWALAIILYDRRGKQKHFKNIINNMKNVSYNKMNKNSTYLNRPIN